MRKEKQLLLDEVKGHINRSDAFLIMQYQSLSANVANDFRRQIAKNGDHLEIVRKRVLIKAAEAAGVTLDLAAMPGHIGLLFVGKDPIESAKFAIKFGKESNQSVKVIGGKFEGQLFDESQIERLSQLPGKDEMRAQLLGTFEAPMSQTLAVLEALLTSVVYCLDNKSQQESS